MKFPPHILDEIRARLPVSAVVSRRVRLKRQGREFVGLSPFKEEKTPSFTVNDQKGFYHCFATGEHGDIFTFLMKTEGLSFPEAVQQLAGEAGVDLPKPTAQDEAREAERDRLLRLTETACAWFQDQLRGNAGAEARDYLHGRGLDTETIAAFRIGYAPASRTALKSHLAAHGFSVEDMAAAGMVIAGEDIATPYDRFRHRIIFPITDLRGRVIAFGGRALDPDQPAKYLNSPETPLFHKGATLFNAANARKASHERGEVIVAEGYMDVIALAAAGFPQAVAPLGTALTEQQIKLLWRMADEPVLCFDGDEAGGRAAYRAAEGALALLSPGKSLRFAYLPEGLDPDDLIRREGAGAMRAVLEQAKPLIDLIWQCETSAGDWSTPERRAALEARLHTLAGTIAEPTVRNYYTRAFRDRLFQMFRSAPQRRQQPVRARTNGWRQPSAGYGERAGASEALANSALVRRPDGGSPVREAVIVQALVRHPWLLDTCAEGLATLQLQSQPARRLLDALNAAHVTINQLDIDSLRHHLHKMGMDDALKETERLAAGELGPHLREGTPHADVEAAWQHITALHRKASALRHELAAAEQAFAEEQSEENFIRLRALSEELANLDNGADLPDA